MGAYKSSKTKQHTIQNHNSTLNNPINFIKQDNTQKPYRINSTFKILSSPISQENQQKSRAHNINIPFMIHNWVLIFGIFKNKGCFLINSHWQKKFKINKITTKYPKPTNKFIYTSVYMQKKKDLFLSKEREIEWWHLPAKGTMKKRTHRKSLSSSREVMNMTKIKLQRS